MLLDIKREIAKHDDQAWYRLWRYDHEFKHYADSYAGRLVFVALFTTVNNSMTAASWRLFGILHRIDGPAIIVEIQGFRDNCLVAGPDGHQQWYRRGKKHRDGDQPAVNYSGITLKWYQNGKKHRDGDQPAIVYKDSQGWYQNNKLHRDGDLPAIVHVNGCQEWYWNGLRHRDDGPAIIYANGSQKWYQNGKLHRDDGPAIVGANGTKKWYQNGVLQPSKSLNI